MELVNSDKLTATMERIRSGSTMLFREKNQNDRSFIDRSNADVVLTHPTNRAMYADLVGGLWYWVNGCSHCDPSQSSYVVCDKHDRCLSCRQHRSEIKGAVWGVEGNSWRCNSCQRYLDKAAKQEALLRVANAVEECGEYDEWEYMHLDNIKCPHCGTEHEACTADGVPEGDETCYVCGGEYTITPDYSITYTTTVKGERLLPDAL